jgi:hypothetical protein
MQIRQLTFLQNTLQAADHAMSQWSKEEVWHDESHSC